VGKPELDKSCHRRGCGYSLRIGKQQSGRNVRARHRRLTHSVQRTASAPPLNLNVRQRRDVECEGPGPGLESGKLTPTFWIPGLALRGLDCMIRNLGCFFFSSMGNFHLSDCRSAPVAVSNRRCNLEGFLSPILSGRQLGCSLASACALAEARQRRRHFGKLARTAKRLR